VGGAVILELFAARFAPNTGQFRLSVAVIGTVKQALEWVGELVFLYSLVDYIRLNMQPVILHPHVIEQISQVINDSADKRGVVTLDEIHKENSRSQLT
jgi:hypothetical protein